MQTRDTDLLACARTRVSRSTQVSHFDVLCCAEFCEHTSEEQRKEIAAGQHTRILCVWTARQLMNRPSTFHPPSRYPSCTLLPPPPIFLPKEVWVTRITICVFTYFIHI